MSINMETLPFNAEGYLEDTSVWTEEIAKEIAKTEKIELTDKHFEVLNFVRGCHAKEQMLTIRKIGKSGIVDIKGFYQLFPGKPLKLATKIAGVPKPSSCV